ncbi:Complex I intermediate-associated protein 30, mitochondrial [Hypsibius exemplaris]|uniref:Complex I intermediate-associated protein 30, mitochondrial n=1 Tax=Hypsibius exemplaris TaxID=2072580 RepID=A0A1W0WN60_HYPEX|nr:Complex I intermediate-associated protein 30, mitochondrial [Hypsibius exemplaris]
MLPWRLATATASGVVGRRTGLAGRRTSWSPLQRAPARWAQTFYEPDERGGYRSFIEYENWYDRFRLSQIKARYRWYLRGFRTLGQELRKYARLDPMEYLRHGDVRMVHDLRNAAEHDSWIVTADSDYDQGRSWGEFSITQHQTGVFSGILNQEPVKDGHTKAAGYVNLRAPFVLRSFDRIDLHDWQGYTHMVVKLRGDGRTYLLNLNVPGTFDVTWADTYNYPLYTRGGPYWQIERIPFSKFFFGHKGRIQDIQGALDLQSVRNIGITLADGVDGPFRLEIEYIAVEYDENYTEEFAYEMYGVVDKYH